MLFFSRWWLVLGWGDAARPLTVLLRLFRTLVWHMPSWHSNFRGNNKRSARKLGRLRHVAGIATGESNASVPLTHAVCKNSGGEWLFLKIYFY